MSLGTSLLYCWALLLLHTVSSSAAGVSYKQVGSEGNQQLLDIIHARFARGEDNVTRDYHTYYTSTYYPPTSPVVGNLWRDLASIVGGGVQVDDFAAESQLSGLHRYYEVHDLKFQFPFYGHLLDSIAVTTGGFLYTGDLLHDQVAATQLIAPLQADFNPNHTDTGRVLVWSTEERFTVQWDMVHNHDHQNDGPFTFQVSLYPSGVIHFVYKEVPLLLGDIDNEGHPVEVGLSDAFYVYYDVRGGTLVHIYEYDRISLNSSRNLTNSAYLLFPVLNCVSATSCEQCANISSVSNFECGWCDELVRCSDGFDRYRQDWFQSGCHREQETMCTSSASSSSLTTSARAGISVAVILLVLLAGLILLGLSLFLYAYRTPTSRMGQFIIKYRPKARTLNKDSSVSYNVSSEKKNLEEDTSSVM